MNEKRFLGKGNNKGNQLDWKYQWSFSLNLLMIAWVFYGYFRHYSEGSQLILNTGNSIISFLMLFLIQKGQNKAGKVTQLKLDEIIYALETGNNKRLGIEKLSEGELDLLKEEYIIEGDLEQDKA